MGVQHPSASSASADAREELRQRMRLRLAATHSAAPRCRRTSVEPQAAPAVVSADGESVVVSHLVWNSVLESLSTTIASQPQPVVQPTFVPPSPIVTEVPPPPAPVEPVPVHVEPISPAAADNSTIAALFVASTPIDFSRTAGRISAGDRTSTGAPGATSVGARCTGCPSPPKHLCCSSRRCRASWPQQSPPMLLREVAADVIVPAMPTLAPPTRAAAPPKPVRHLMGDDSLHTVAVSSAKKKSDAHSRLCSRS